MRLHSARRDARAVAPIIAEILLVAMSVTLAALLFAYTNQITSQTAGVIGKPFVVLTAAATTEGNETVTVAAVSEPFSVSSYRVSLVIGGSAGTPTAIGPSGRTFSISVGEPAYAVIWTDLGGGRTLNGGDTFRIGGAHGPLPGGESFRFLLVWSDGSVVGSVSWTT